MSWHFHFAHIEKSIIICIKFSTFLASMICAHCQIHFNLISLEWQLILDHLLSESCFENRKDLQFCFKKSSICSIALMQTTFKHSIDGTANWKNRHLNVHKCSKVYIQTKALLSSYKSHLPSTHTGWPQSELFFSFVVLHCGTCHKSSQEHGLTSRPLSNLWRHTYFL